MGKILVGTASWTDRTLIDSGWYPPEAKTAEQRLRYYARQFPLVEVDATYYAPPSDNAVRAWVERSPAEFTFNIKAFSLLTQHPTRPAALYADLRDRVPSDRKNLYARDLPADLVDEVWDRFLVTLQPLARAGKIGAILFQFPQWFPIGSANKKYILECQRRCAPLPVCVEFRNRTWMEDRNQRETLDFLSSYAVPYVCVDMPQGYPTSIPPVVAATANLAVMRFHGHSDRWTSKDIHERFGYRYGDAELREWAPRLRELAEQADTTHVLMNNCYTDYAQVNARQLADLLAD
ncbi:DUF72 domain-containing protein [Pseudofrankia inefficax]|uniref:DUF72 domain-containing protein n=1 Tax=Pseudofrankia inefficax (strain DSM 45817 / CECT 9037 / DDB 130130 / EuI1c) TaxID=298654 RepID=E3J8F7_PSEI1|nr:DUF72 domain-containing protein [Pseudofrankia inefficax]ADP84491.1 protein of unknown function DUF72 [Pseudofrankia inefficax]